MSELLDGIDAGDLLLHMPSSVRVSLEALDRAGTDWNAVGNLLAGTHTTGVAVTGTGQWTVDLWQAVKWEFRSFVYTDSEPYGELRQQWDELKRQSSARAVASLAVLIGRNLGVASGLLVPLVTWLFVVAGRTEKEAFCRACATVPSGAMVP